MQTEALKPTQTYADLEEQLFAMGAQFRRIEGDGNCFFRAMSDQMTGDCNSHGTYRRDTAEYMLTHRDMFTDFIVTDDYEEYVRTLGQDGIYVDNESILAFANLIEVTVVVHQLNQTPITISANAEDPRDELHVTYEAQHYNSVRWSSEEPDTVSPAAISCSQLKKHLDRFTALEKARLREPMVSDTSEGESSGSSGKSDVSLLTAESGPMQLVKSLADNKGVRLEKAIRVLEISNYNRKTAERILDEDRKIV